jgi:hypothetical protein
LVDQIVVRLDPKIDRPLRERCRFVRAVIKAELS